MVMEYMSSDESDLSDEDGEVVLKGYKTKKLAWERSRQTKVKKELDDTYYRSLPRRTRKAILQRRPHTELSSRCCPEEPIAWAVREGNATSNSASSSHNSTPVSYNSTPVSRNGISLNITGPLSPIF